MEPPEEIAETQGVSFVEQLAGAAGVDPAALRSLVEAGRITGLMDADGRARFVLDDTMPGPDELRALGVEPGQEYDPGEVPSYPWAWEPSDDEDDGPRSGWTITWPPPE